jgi:hypothetical protein
MTEPFPNHQIQSIGRGSVRARTKWILGHDLSNCYIPGIDPGANYAESKVLRSKYTRDTILIVSDKDAVFTFRSHNLCGLRNSGIGLYLQSL